jgi:hypothetical protein
MERHDAREDATPHNQAERCIHSVTHATWQAVSDHIHQSLLEIAIVILTK